MSGIACGTSGASDHLRRLGVHASVLLAVLPMAACLVLLNWYGERLPSQRIFLCGFDTIPPGRPTDFAVYEHGWPQTYAHRTGDNLSAWSLTSDVSSFDGGALAIDASISVSAVIALLAVLEFLRRQRGSLTRWYLRDLLTGISLVAAGLCWWNYNKRQWAIEQQAIAALPDGACLVSPLARPVWLSRIVGRERLFIFDRVTWLSWRDDVDDRTILSLAENIGLLSSLEGMTFYGTLISDVGLSAALESTAPPSIDLPDAAVTGVGLAVLPAGSLRSLFASGSKFSDAGMAAIADQTKLEQLNLPRTGVTDAGVRHLLRMRRLRFLDLRDTQITEAAAATLGQLKSLAHLGLPEKLPPSAIARLRAMLPDTEVVTAPDPAIPATVPEAIYESTTAASGGYGTSAASAK